MLERLKNIWTWVSIVLLILCVLCYLLANPVLWVSEAPRSSNHWLTLLALVCLAFQTAIQWKKLREPVWSCNWEWFAIIIGTYLLFTFYPG